MVNRAHQAAEKHDQPHQSQPQRRQHHQPAIRQIQRIICQLIHTEGRHPTNIDRAPSIHIQMECHIRQQESRKCMTMIDRWTNAFSSTTIDSIT